MPHRGPRCHPARRVGIPLGSRAPCSSEASVVRHLAKFGAGRRGYLDSGVSRRRWRKRLAFILGVADYPCGDREQRTNVIRRGSRELYDHESSRILFVRGRGIGETLIASCKAELRSGRAVTPLLLHVGRVVEGMLHRDSATLLGWLRAAVVQMSVRPRRALQGGMWSVGPD